MSVIGVHHGSFNLTRQSPYWRGNFENFFQKTISSMQTSQVSKNFGEICGNLGKTGRDEKIIAVSPERNRTFSGA